MNFFTRTLFRFNTRFINTITNPFSGKKIKNLKLNSLNLDILSTHIFKKEYLTNPITGKQFRKIEATEDNIANISKNFFD